MNSVKFDFVSKALMLRILQQPFIVINQCDDGTLKPHNNSPDDCPPSIFFYLFELYFSLFLDKKMYNFFANFLNLMRTAKISVYNCC